MLQGDAAATDHHGTRVLRLVAGDGAEQTVVHERLERPAAGLRGVHGLQGDAAALSGGLYVEYRRLTALHDLRAAALLLLLLPVRVERVQGRWRTEGREAEGAGHQQQCAGKGQSL